MRCLYSELSLWWYSEGNTDGGTGSGTLMAINLEELAIKFEKREANWRTIQDTNRLILGKLL